MKLIILVILIAAAGPLSAADKSDAHTDPFAGAFFPPDLVLLARDQIGLTQQQQEAFRALVEKVQPRSDELRAKLERETATLSALAKQERLDEAALTAQLDKVLDVERELKHLQVGLLVAIKNLLTPEQRTKLREIAKDGGTKLMEEGRKRLTAKVDRVTQGVQKWAASGRDPSTILKTMQEKVGPLLEAGKAIEAEAELDRILEQLGDKQLGDKKAEGAAADASAIPQEASYYAERLPPKIQKIQEQLPAWIQKPGNQEKAAAFMQKLKGHLDAKNFAEAEKTADAILKTIGVNAPAAGQSGENKPQPTPPSGPPSNDTKKRLTEKVERVEAGVQKWIASGRDPSDIAKAMQEKFKPLMEAGKPLEAEAELDRILEQLGDKKAEGAAADAPAIPQEASSYEERLPPKIHKIQKELPAWSEKPGNQEKATVFMQKLKEHLAAMNFVEAEKTADAMLKMMGVIAAAADQSGQKKPTPTQPSSPSSDDTKKRLTEKVERVKTGAQKWAASGRDPSDIAKAMEEKFKPLMEAGKVAEAEAELDRVLEQLKQGPK